MQEASGGSDKQVGGPRTVLPSHPQKCPAADNGGAWTPDRHNTGTDGPRPQDGAIARHTCGLLAPTGTVVNPDDVWDLGSKEGHETTRGAVGQSQRATE